MVMKRIAKARRAISFRWTLFKQWAETKRERFFWWLFMRHRRIYDIVEKLPIDTLPF